MSSDEVRGGPTSHDTHEDPRRTGEDRGSNASLNLEPGEEEVTDAHTRERPPIFLCVIQIKVHTKMPPTVLYFLADLCDR